MRRRLSVKEKLEKVKTLASREHEWSKESGRQIKKFAIGGKDHIFSDSSKFPKSTFAIHNHPIQKGEKTSLSLPSPSDITHLAALMGKGSAKTGTVVSVDRRGEVVGYCVFKLNRSLTLQESAEFSFSASMALEWLQGKELIERWEPTIHERLSQKGVKLKLKFVPMHGYKFDSNTKYFVKK